MTRRRRGAQMVALGLVLVAIAAGCIAEGTWGPARPGTTPQVVAPGVVDSIDCVGGAWCLSAGGGSIGGTTVGSAAEWDGVGWQPTASPPVPISELDCAAVDDCWAIGNGRLHHWSGSAWSTPDWPTSARPVALSCPVVGWCGVAATVGTSPVVVGWNGTATSSLGVPAAAAVEDVACPAANRCMAVGTDGVHAFSARWTGGTTWTTYPVPGFASLRSVGCATTLRCHAASIQTGSIATWSAYVGGWGASTPDTLAEEAEVECGGGACLAITSSRTWPEGAWVSRVVGLDGTPPAVPHDAVGYRDATCGGPSSCLISAGDLDLDRWDGTAWSADATDLASLHGERAQDISCSPDGRCIAIGQGGRSPAVIHTDGTAVGPLLPGFAADPSTRVDDTAVSCRSTGWCAMAALLQRWDIDAGYDTEVDLVTGTDGAWAHQRLPVDDLVGGRVALDCPSPLWCLAVVGSDAATEAFVWNGVEWSNAGALANPATPVGLDCGSPTDCVAVTRSAAGSHLRWWTGTSFGPPTTVPAPSGGDGIAEDLGCRADRSCVVVGSASSGGTSQPWAVEIDPAGTAVPATLPSPVDGPGGLRAVSCTSAACLALGDATVGGTAQAVALGWQGSWVVLGGPLPSVADGETVWEAVSCRDQQCTAAGTTALAEGGSRIDVARFTWPA